MLTLPDFPTSSPILWIDPFLHKTDKTGIFPIRGRIHETVLYRVVMDILNVEKSLLSGGSVQIKCIAFGKMTLATMVNGICLMV
jgi:hypothetical protein